MADKTCVVCGRPIRTGWKYCYEHRNYHGPKSQTNRPSMKISPKMSALIMAFVFLVIGYALLSNAQLCGLGLFLILAGLFLAYITIRSKEEAKSDLHNIMSWLSGFGKSKKPVQIPIELYDTHPPGYKWKRCTFMVSKKEVLGGQDYILPDYEQCKREEGHAGKHFAEFQNEYWAGGKWSGMRHVFINGKMYIGRLPRKGEPYYDAYI